MFSLCLPFRPRAYWARCLPATSASPVPVSACEHEWLNINHIQRGPHLLRLSNDYLNVQNFVQPTRPLSHAWSMPSTPNRLRLSGVTGSSSGLAATARPAHSGRRFRTYLQPMRGSSLELRGDSRNVRNCCTCVVV